MFDKAKLFINRALSDTRRGNFEENALWASLALELLGKAALSKINPLLIAEPTADDGKSMLIAAGILDEPSAFRSIAAKAVFSRCAKAFPPFSSQNAMKFAHDRNAYLHGASAFHARFPEEVWWSRFWPQAVLLLSAQDRSIEDFVGHSMTDRIDGYLAKNSVFVKDLVKARVERARQRLQLVERNAISARVAAEIKVGASTYLAADYETSIDCPVCASPDAKVGGWAVENREVVVDGGDYSVWLTIGSEVFGCGRCGLALDDYEQITESDVPDSFDVLDEDPDFGGEEYGND
ncbi:hypothetical protein ACFXPS_30845 [Nocardia sp. NPDC059091]|uniref:hypothetical protein n=1 Tax=Nocardia sp. NPDC059091 TaxID=3346724 RepID=UPI0036C357AE